MMIVRLSGHPLVQDSLTPPLMPMVFPEHNYVRVVLVSQSREGWGWGRTAMLAQNVPYGLVVGYSRRA